MRMRLWNQLELEIGYVSKMANTSSTISSKISMGGSVGEYSVLVALFATAETRGTLSEPALLVAFAEALVVALDRLNQDQNVPVLADGVVGELFVGLLLLNTEALISLLLLVVLGFESNDPKIEVARVRFGESLPSPSFWLAFSETGTMRLRNRVWKICSNKSLGTVQWPLGK